jgi:hypothetical protein
MAILNTGWQRGGTARLNLPNPDKGWKSEPIPVFAPVAFAGNGVRLGQDTLDRTITIRLYRDPSAPELRWEELADVVERLQLRLADWAESAASLRNVKRPPMPDGVGGRDRDRWQILSSAAEGTSRADWRAALIRLCLADHASREASREEAGHAPTELLMMQLYDCLPISVSCATEDMVMALQIHDPARMAFLRARNSPRGSSASC